MPKTAAFALAFLAICRAQGPQQANAVGRIGGQVTSMTGEPVKNAKVRLLALNRVANGVPNQPLDTYNTASDASGNFAFESVPVGQYQVSAEHSGYLRSVGRTANSVAVTVDAGQTVTGVSLELMPEGRIEGAITDEAGEPAPDAHVFVLSWTASNGFKRLVNQQSNGHPGASDGTFVIGGLTAGHYYILADVEHGSDVPRGRSAHEAYIPTYYPGVGDLASATLVKVDAGAVIRGLNIRMRRAAVYRFQGKAINSVTNAPAAGVSVAFLPASLLRIIQPRSAVTQDDGSFDLYGLAPGDYTVEVGYARPPTGGPATRLFASPITIGNRDVEGGVLRLGPAVQIEGRVAVEGGGPPPEQSRLAIGLSSVSGGVPSARSDRDNSFVIRDLSPAKYVANVMGLTPGMYVKAVRFGNQDVTGKFIDLTSSTGGTLEIVLAPNAADVSGRIQDSKGNPLPQVQVSLWKPGQPSPDGMFPPLAAVTDGNGGFHVANLAPGEYRVAAWAGNVAVFAPEFLSQFDAAAATVKLQQGSRETVDAPLIPQDAIESALANLR